MTDDYLETCKQAARAGGAVLREYYGQCQVREKSPANLVTEADLASQATIRQILLTAYPSHDFVGEEDDGQTVHGHRYRWVVDPLDGTTNFAHGMPKYAVSIALLDGDQPLVGVVFDPVMDHCFWASAGGGAFLNDQRMRVSGVEHLSAALLAASFPPKVSATSPAATDYLRVSACCQATRRMGSAALNLCYLARGWFDGCWGIGTQLWDVAAGMLLVQEAGGLITGWQGQALDPLNPTFIACATPVLHRELCEHLSPSPAIV